MLGNLEYRRFRIFGISSVIYKNERVLISSSTMDPLVYFKIYINLLKLLLNI